MAVKEEKLLDVGKMNSEYQEVIGKLIENARQKLDELNHNCLLAQNTLKLTTESIVRQKNEFDQWKRLEDQKHQNALNLKHNEYAAREHALQKNEEQISKRLQDLQTREQQAANILEERNQLNNDRIGVQKLKIAAEQLMNEASSKISSADNVINIANKKETESNDLKQKYDALNIQLSNREADIDKKSENLNLQIKNLNELNAIVDPKIKEIDLRDQGLKQRESDLVVKQADVDRKIADDKAMLLALEDKDRKLSLREKEVTEREEEVKRKLLQISTK